MTIPKTWPQGRGGPLAKDSGHHPDVLTEFERNQLHEKLDAQLWISRTDMIRLCKSHALASSALAGAVIRGWQLAGELEEMGQETMAEKLKDWCRHMRRVCAKDWPGLPKMPAPEPKKLVMP